MLCSSLLSGLRHQIHLFFFLWWRGTGFKLEHIIYKKWIFWLFLAILPTQPETSIIFLLFSSNSESNDCNSTSQVSSIQYFNFCAGFRSCRFHIDFFHLILQAKCPFNTLASGRKRDIWKKHWNACRFAQELLRSCTGYGPGRSVKRRIKSSSLHSKKKLFAWGVWVVCEWHHMWRTFRPPWPTLPGHGHQPLDGSISQKFLL